MNKDSYDNNKATPIKNQHLNINTNLDNEFDSGIKVPNQVSDNPSFPEDIFPRKNK